MCTELWVINCHLRPYIFYFHSLKSQYRDLKGKKKRVAQGVLGLIPRPDLSACVPTTLSQSPPPQESGSFHEADHARLGVNQLRSVCADLCLHQR